MIPPTTQLAFVYCGDGIEQTGEECDDGNTRDFDNCSAQCKVELGKCGDGDIQKGYGEECDQGNLNGTSVALCDIGCRKVRTPLCGDGIVDPSTEECDLGSQNGDYPSSRCLYNCLLPYCGDGLVSVGEQCDDGNQFDLDKCDHLCKLETVVAAPPEPTGKTGDPYGRTYVPQPKIVYQYPDYVPTPARTPTGPGLVIFLASGAAAGVGLVRRKFLGK